MRKRIFAAVLSLLLIVLTLSSCINQHQEKSQENSANARLIATSPAIADICDKLDLELVGVCNTISAIPERYTNLPKVGMAMSPDLELIKSLHPDYIFSPATLKNDLQPKYASTNIRCIFLNLSSVDGMYASIKGMGEKFGKEKQANALIKDYEKFMEEYKHKNKGKKAPKVLVLMGLPGSYIVATENSYVGSLVKLAGGENIYAGEKDEFITVNTEDMYKRDADIILRTAHALPDQVKEMFAKEFSTNDVWKHFTAVKNNKVYDLSPLNFGMSAKFNYKEALEEIQPYLYGDGNVT
ncbi:MAG: heme ABC transporter substrate-binding protein IsdE [Candidatus Fimenecus sp.]